MPDQEIAALGPVFAGYRGRFRDCFLQKRDAAHFDNACHGLLSELPRESVEPIALACGTAVRTLQELLIEANWPQASEQAPLHREIAAIVNDLADDSLGML